MNISASTLGDISSKDKSSPYRKTKQYASHDDCLIGARAITAREESGMSRLEVAAILRPIIVIKIGFPSGLLNY